MRYSEYFVQVALHAQNGDKVAAEKLLREAEHYAQKKCYQPRGFVCQGVAVVS